MIKRDSTGKFIKGHRPSEEMKNKIRNTHIGMGHTEASKKKISEAKKGFPAWNKGMTFGYKERPWMKGKTPWNKGRHIATNNVFSIGNKLGALRKGKKMPESWRLTQLGSQNPNWKGGTTPLFKKIRKSFEYEAWRKSIFERDNYQCQFCGQVGGILHADHIKPFAFYEDLRFELSNGRTLCVPCHKKTETYGYKAVSWHKKNSQNI